MRILLASEYYYPSVGGVQEVMHQIGERFVAHGHEVTIATSYLPERHSQIQGGVRIKEFRVAGNLVRGLTGEIERYRAFVVESDYDVLMVKAAQQWTFDALTPVLDKITRPKLFVPCGFSGLLLAEYAGYFAKMPDWLRKWDHLVFYATDYRDINFARQHGLTQLSIVPNGASEREFMVPRDEEFRRRHRIPNDAFVVLTVGSLNGQKGHQELAEAFALARFDYEAAVLILNGNVPGRVSVRQRATRFWIALKKQYHAGGPTRALKWVLKAILLGAGLSSWLSSSSSRKPSLDELVRRVNDAAPAKRAYIADLRRQELVQAYLNSDLFVFASNVEYSPLVLYEAAAAGLPFLSVPVGNAEEIARWTGAGEICPAPRDALGYTRVEPLVLAEHMQAMASDPERLKALGDAGRRNWLERFTWTKIVDQYEALFERLISEKNVSRGRGVASK